MTNDQLASLNRYRKIFQIAFVTRDLERTMKAWIETLGVGPWRVAAFTEDTVRDFIVHGAPVGEPVQVSDRDLVDGRHRTRTQFRPCTGPPFTPNSSTRKAKGCTTSRSGSATRRSTACWPITARRESASCKADVSSPTSTITSTPKARSASYYELGNCPWIDVPPGIFSTYPAENTAAGSRA